MLKLRTLLLYNKIYIILFFLITIFSIIFCNFYKYKSIYLGDETNINGYIDDIKIDGNKITIKLKAKEKIKAIYYTQNKNELIQIKKEYKLGDFLNLEGELNKVKNNTLFNLFNNKKYLYYHKIFYILNVKKIHKIKNNNNCFYKLKQLLIDRINNLKYSNKSIKAFAFSESYYIDEYVSETYKTNGISHLLALSGSNISMLSILLLFIFKKMKISEIKRYILIIILLIFYSFLANFSPSIIRATLFFILISINKIYYFNIKTINILILTYCILIIINPFYLYDLGFQFSFVICFYLIFFSDYISSNNKLITLFKVSLISFLSSMPIVIYNFFQINILSIIYNLFFVPLVSFIIYPFSLLTIIFPFLDSILYKFIIIMEETSVLVDKIEISKIILAKPNLYVMFLYYLLITLAIYNLKKQNYKYLLILIVIIFFHNNIAYINKYSSVTMIDVGQGDSILISLNNNKADILIDTGGKTTYYNEKYKLKNKNYSIAKNTIIPYLKSIGIKNLDYLIITHGDEDHMGEAINLVENFKVEKVIFNCGEFNDLEQELIKVLDKKKIPYYSCIKELNIDDNKLYFLNNKDYGNENDNSSVIYSELNNHKFLFMGDAGVEVEQDLIEKYNLQDIDVLKVGHHGSKTSSGKEFINEINSKYSVISVGKNNRYGHPNKEVLDNLKNSKIYRTDIDGSIMFKIKNNKFKIETCSP